MTTKKVINRKGELVDFDKERIINVVLKSFSATDGTITDYATMKADNIANYIEKIAQQEELTIEEIQDYVQKGLMATKRKDVARNFIIYREQKAKERNIKETLLKKYEQLNALVRGEDEESKKENSNKDTRIIPTMRDYLAGFTCRELAESIILPKDVSDAHKAGIIHYHDSDYSPAMPMSNCCLVNLEDMLQNGTVISGVMIEKPKSFRTACTVTTQISAQVASSQYGW